LDLRDGVELLILYVGVHITRAIVVLVLYPFLNRSGYGLNFKEAVILVFSGLRGAVGLAMAMMVEGEQNQPLDHDLRSRIAFHVSGIALLTMTLNGMAIKPVYHKLAIYSKAKHHSILLYRALCQAEVVSRQHTLYMREHWFFHNLDFNNFERLVPQLHLLYHLNHATSRY
jgi:NhaP-type Na+/H+ or K+/H+ antiporter